MRTVWSCRTLVWIPGQLTNQMARVRLQDVEQRSSKRSKYSSTEFQGFVGLSAGKPVSMMSQFCCRIAIVDRLASDSNRRERHCEANPDCGRP